MIILHWDATNPETGEPYAFDDPNLRWGSPSYALTRGDYGFYDPNQTKHTKPMRHQDYYPIRVGDQIIWLTNLYQKLPNYATNLGLSAPELAEIIADVRWYIYVIEKWVPAVRAYNQAVTAAAKAVASGNGGLVPLPVFTAPALPGAEGTLPAVTPRTEGVLTRLFDAIAEWKENNNCTDTMCEDLGIIGSTESGPDLDTITPEITATRSGSTVDIKWNWQGASRYLDSCEIEVDRGTGWALLTIDTTPGYTDTAAQPATPAIWKYRAIYRVNDARTGQWSQEVSIITGS